MTATPPELIPTFFEDPSRKILDRLITDSPSLRLPPSAPCTYVHPGDEVLHQFGEAFRKEHADKALIGALPRGLNADCTTLRKGKEVCFSSGIRRGWPR